MVYDDPDDPKKGISQSDLYQVLAYAVRYKIDEVALLYPDTIQNYQTEVSGFTIRDEFADQVDVKITAWQLPVINRELMDGHLDNSEHQLSSFDRQNDLLKERMLKIFQR